MDFPRSMLALAVLVIAAGCTASPQTNVLPPVDPGLLSLLGGSTTTSVIGLSPGGIAIVDPAHESDVHPVPDSQIAADIDPKVSFEKIYENLFTLEHGSNELWSPSQNADTTAGTTSSERAPNQGVVSPSGVTKVRASFEDLSPFSKPEVRASFLAMLMTPGTRVRVEFASQPAGGSIRWKNVPVGETTKVFWIFLPTLSDYSIQLLGWRPCNAATARTLGWEFFDGQPAIVVNCELVKLPAG